jgi:hypothetical protein
VNVRSAALLACAFFALAPSRAVYAQQEHASPPAPMPCVEVRIGQDRAGRLDCLNRTLRAEVDKAAPTITGDAVSGRSPDQIGQPTTAALKQRYGTAYGHSLVPQRPPRTFAPPLPPVR